jgi:ankyrin repeat protein
MSNVHDASESGHQWTEPDLIEKLGGGPYVLASSSNWPKSLAFLRHSGTLENFQHAVWGLAENSAIEDRDSCGAIESYLHSVPTGITDWAKQLRCEELASHMFSPLSKLICNHRVNTATMLINAGMDPDFPCDSAGRTAIQAAILFGSLNVDDLKILLDSGASPQGERDPSLCQSHVAICKELPLFSLWKRFILSEKKPIEATELMFVELISSGALIDQLDPAGNNIAHVLCTVGSTDSVAALIAMRGGPAKALFVVVRATDGFWPIHIACSLGHAQLIPMLIELGARPTSRIDISTVRDKNAYCCPDLGTSTCFYLALISGKSSSAALNIFKKLEQKSVAASVHSASGTTPLHWCVWHHRKSMKDTEGQMQLVNSLISSGCSIEKRDHAGRLPIHLACAGGHHSLIPILAATVSIINDRLAMNSQFCVKVTSPKVIRLRTLVKTAAVHSGAVTAAHNDTADLAASGPSMSEPCVVSVQSAVEHMSVEVDGVTPLMLAIMSRDTECVKNVLVVPGLLKFQMSSEPGTSLLTTLPPESPFVLHFGAVVDSNSDKKNRICNDVVSRFKQIDRNTTSLTTPNTNKPDIHSPLSYAIISAQFSIVDAILEASTKNDAIDISELILSKIRCADDFCLLLLSSIVKIAKLSQLPEHIQNIIPQLDDILTCQLAAIPSLIPPDGEYASDIHVNDSNISKLLFLLSNIAGLPQKSEGMPHLQGCMRSTDRTSLSSAHMACILGYSLCCETLMKINPLQNYSLFVPSGSISPLHLCIIYKRFECFQSLMKLSPPDLLSISIQEPLLNHLRPIHLAVLSTNLNIVTELCLTFKSLQISDCEFISCLPAFMFQLLARAGSGYDLEKTFMQGTSRFHCIALSHGTLDSVYSNHLTVAFSGGSINAYFEKFDRSKTSIFSKLHISCIDCLVLCGLYGLTSHCRFLLSKCVPSCDRKTEGYFVDSFGSWIPMLVSVIRDWGHMDENPCWTPVNVSIHRGHSEILDLLLSHGHNCNTRSPFGWTPLTFACFDGNAPLVELLLSHHAIPSRPDSVGWTPVMVCVTKLGLRRIRYSAQVTGEWSIERARDRLCDNLSKGFVAHSEEEPCFASVTMPTFEETLNLSSTLKDSNTTILYSLLEKSTVSSEYSPHGWSALYTAISLQQLSIANTLIGANANVNDGCSDGRQPLFAACSIPHIPLVLHLLKLKADPNPAVPTSRTKLSLQTVVTKEGTGQMSAQYQCLPIVAACKSGSISIVLALLAACYSASVFPDSEIVSAASSACIESISMHILGILLVHPATRNHAFLSIAESFHKTCLLSLMLWAGDTCQLWAIHAALSMGGDVNGTKNGTSPLHIVCSRPKSFKIAVFLVEQVTLPTTALIVTH